MKQIFTITKNSLLGGLIGLAALCGLGCASDKTPFGDSRCDVEAAGPGERVVCFAPEFQKDCRLLIGDSEVKPAIHPENNTIEFETPAVADGRVPIRTICGGEEILISERFLVEGEFEEEIAANPDVSPPEDCADCSPSEGSTPADNSYSYSYVTRNPFLTNPSLWNTIETKGTQPNNPSVAGTASPSPTLTKAPHGFEVRFEPVPDTETGERVVEISWKVMKGHNLKRLYIFGNLNRYQYNEEGWGCSTPGNEGYLQVHGNGTEFNGDYATGSPCEGETDCPGLKKLKDKLKASGYTPDLCKVEIPIKTKTQDTFYTKIWGETRGGQLVAVAVSEQDEVKMVDSRWIEVKAAVEEELVQPEVDKEPDADPPASPKKTTPKKDPGIDLTQKVKRVGIVVRTCDKDDASTEGNIALLSKNRRLMTFPEGPNRPPEIKLRGDDKDDDSGGDDLEKNKRHEFIRSVSKQTLKDLSQIRLRSETKDDYCLANIQLNVRVAGTDGRDGKLYVCSWNSGSLHNPQGRKITQCGDRSCEGGLYDHGLPIWLSSDHKRDGGDYQLYKKVAFEVDFNKCDKE